MNGGPPKTGRSPWSLGFTLIELMIVVSILSILTALAVPRFGTLLKRSNEANSVANLAKLRSALSVYYTDMEGLYPSHLAVLTVAGKYLDSMPQAREPSFHTETSTILLGTVPDDTGGWVYNNNASDANFGTIWINCTHTDTKGTVWTVY